MFSALALGFVLSITPIFPLSGPLNAQAPATAVTGLSRGAQGDAVRTVQQALVNQGVTVVGGVDGIFGAGTEAALKQFQSQRGLPASGVVDTATELELGLSSSPVLGLSQGVRGDEVRQLQQQLIDAGITVSGGADGIFGPGTAAAVKHFQSDHGFSPTGIVDSSTAAALAEITPSQPIPEATEPKAAEPKAAEPAADSSTASDPSAQAAASKAELVGLKIGSRGTAVQTLQQLIIDSGFTVVGGADGIFGVLTSNALRSFQNANALGVTGVVDEATATALGKVTAPAPGDEGTSHDPTVSASPLLGLKYGSIGADVKALQHALVDAGIRVPGGADGVFGTATQSSLKQYQAGLGFDQTGRVDDATANALASAEGSTAVSTSPMLGLQYGALGNTVKSLQQALIDAGITVRGGADGIFGPATTNAVKEFQKSQGIEATGKADEATVASLANPQAVPSSSPSSAVGYAAYGEKGERVAALQSALVSAGLTVRGGVDGDFGANTSSAVMEFQRLNGLSVTGKISEATASALGLGAASEPVAPDPGTVQIAVFPVQGTCYYGDSYGYPRGGGRTHLGVDILASAGNLLYAAADGKITKIYTDYPGSLSGNGVRLTMADGTYFFYAHMIGVADGIDVGVPVKAGQIVGTVGSTGNSGTPHLHFEVHPQGGAAVNPYPIVKAIDACSNTAPLPQP